MPNGEVVVTAVLALDQGAAFAAFTDQIDRWWDRIGLSAPDAIVRFEGNRLVAVTGAGAEALATVEEWDPPHLLRMAWAGPHSEPGDEVVVTFVGEAGRTRVSVHHRRRGFDPESVIYSIVGLWWADLLSRLIDPHTRTHTHLG